MSVHPEGPVDGVAYHVSPSENRSSILEHGLDSSRMSARGIAGSTSPEVDGVYLATSLWEAWWFAGFQGIHDRVDIWQVEATDLVFVEGPRGHDYYAGSVPPERVKLVETDLVPEDVRAERAAGRDSEETGTNRPS